jgi:outer membrane immunogenic protein
MRRLGPGLVALALAAAAAFAAPARAADMAPAPSYYPPAAAIPMPPALYNWTGFYLGGNAGAGLLDDRVSQSTTTATTTNLTGSIAVAPAGFVGGGQAGLNFEFASWVVGVEALWDATTLTGSPGVATTTSLFEKMTSAPAWYGSATGRLGYAFNDVLVYAKGGGAVMRVGYTQDVLTGGLITSSQVINDNRTGFTVGLGLEYGMTENLSARLEYDFYDFGTKTYGNFGQTPVAISSDLHTLTAGVDYRFDWAGGWH